MLLQQWSQLQQPILRPFRGCCVRRTRFRNAYRRLLGDECHHDELQPTSAPAAEPTIT
jgi:hypothetical protein